MNIQHQILARRYATAFLNYYENSISLDDYYAFKELYIFLNNNPVLLTHFKFPRMDKEKKEAIKKLNAAFKIPSFFEKLTDLLIKQQRLFLIKGVVNSILALYGKRKNIMEFNIASPYSLEKQQLSTVQQFLEKKTKKTILYKQTLNKNLIAGIRLLSGTLLWEYSIAQQLRNAEQLLRS